MHRRIITALALACIGLLAAAEMAGPARADGGDDPLGWLKETTDQGCYRYYARSIGPDTLQGQGFVWTGPCTPGQPISGEGTFYRQFPDGWVMAYTGRIVNGFADGPTRLATYQVSAGAFPPSGAPRSDGQVNFRMGCEEMLGSECRPGSPFNIVNVPQVSPAHFPLPGGPSSFAGSPISGASATPAPASSDAGGDVWGACVTTEAPVQSGIQMIYAFRNICSKTVTVSFCMKATYEAAGDWNLCSQREYKTYDIRAGARFEFPFTPVAPGSAMSDGRVVDRNDVSASGAACIGSSPSVYVENKRLVFQHC